jgi:ribose transport system permease protein
MTPALRGILTTLLRHAPTLLLVLVLLVFGTMSPTFLGTDNLIDILVHSSSVGIVAAGMTVVLLTGGIDLSVGAIMYVAAAVAGKLLLEAGAPLPAAIAAMVGVGVVFGAVNGLFVTVLGLLPFVVTLATFYVGRGYGFWLTRTRAMNLPDEFLAIGHSKVLGVPFPIVIFAVVVAVLHVTLTKTPFGIQLYAVGNDAETARKAGISTRRILLGCYVISGVCAAVGGIVSLAQLGAVSPTFGNRREFDAIAAAVLGGTSLFGGRGRVFPGTIVGAILIQAVYSGLVSLAVDPYLYPIITCAIIFIAVLVDLTRTTALKKLKARRITRGFEVVPRASA